MNDGPIPQAWIEEYIGILERLAAQFPAGSLSSEVTLNRIAHVRDMLKSFRVHGPAEHAKE